MAAFYLLFIPNLIVVFLHKALVEISCLLYSSTMIFASATTSLSSITKPIICFIFVENYRRGPGEFCGSFFIKCSKRRQNIDNCPKGITLNLPFNVFFRNKRLFPGSKKVMSRDCNNSTVVYVANALFANDLKVVSRTCWVSSQTPFL